MKNYRRKISSVWIAECAELREKEELDETVSENKEKEKYICEASTENKYK